MTLTKIEWADRTWTPVVGCDAVSPACAKCYAALMAARLEAMGVEKYAGLATRVGNVGKWTGKVTLWEPELDKPLKVKKPASWFLTSMGDIFHKLVPFTFLDKTFSVMEKAQRHTFYVLSKREGRAAEYLATRTPLPNVVIGCTAENQEQADLRRPAMEAISKLGWRTFVSYEPALGPVDWTGWEFLSWLISGGESGNGARPSHPDWHRDARDFCADHTIAYLFKQWGCWAPGENVPQEIVGIRQHAHWWNEEWMLGETDMSDPEDGWWDEPDVYRVGKKAAGRTLDGVTHDGFPA